MSYHNPKRPPRDTIHITENLAPIEQVIDAHPSHLGFSPTLIALLSSAFGDGRDSRMSYSLLEELYPYVSGRDRNVIEQLLSVGEFADEYKMRGVASRMRHERHPLSHQERFQGLLGTLRKYGGRHNSEMFNHLERYIVMRDTLGRMEDGFDLTALPDIIELFVHDEEHAMAKEMRRAASMMETLSGFRSLTSGGGGQDSMGMDISNMASILSAMQGLGGGMGGGNNTNEGAGGMNLSAMMNMISAMQGNTGGGNNMDMGNMANILSMMNGMGGNNNGGGSGGGFDPSMLMTMMNLMNNNNA